MAIRLDMLAVSTFLQDRPGTHSFIDNNARPVLGTNLYNPSDTDITIVIPAKSRVYLPGQFANTKFANCKVKVTDKFVTIQMPIGGNVPMFNSGKVKT